MKIEIIEYTNTAITYYKIRVKKLFRTYWMELWDMDSPDLTRKQVEAHVFKDETALADAKHTVKLFIEQYKNKYIIETIEV